MATEGGDARDYDATVQPRLRAEAIRVLRAFGFASGHAVIVGGLVPSLLIPKPEAGVDPHIGTQDLDLCLSIALVEGDVGNYERLEKSLKGAGFEMARENGHSVSWRWLGGVDLPLTVEFFCPTAPGRDAGKLYRPGGVVGGKLSAMAIATGRLIDRDVRELELEVDLPAAGGRTRHRVSVAGPAAYLASKADALRRRNKNKDAYDIVWLTEAWLGGQAVLAAEISQSPIAKDTDFKAACGVLGEEFGDIDASGATKYARFMSQDAIEHDAFKRRAVGAVGTFLRELDSRLA